jgi:hypothetical protein
MTPPSLVLSADTASAPSRRARAGDIAVRVLVVAGAVTFAIAWTLLQGKALHWDALNYHFYLGFAALHDRFAQDFFAAGTPSYINPYAYVPLHLMVTAGLPGSIIASILAAVHGLILWLTYELAFVASPASSYGERIAFALLAVLLAAMSPVLLQGLGMTLVDIPLGVLVVASWLAMAVGVRDGSLRWIVIGAVVGGLASGLKLSNAFYALAAGSMTAFVPGSWQRKLKAAVAYGVACGVAFVLVSAPWSWKLWTTFGNPLFPFLNDIFRSPDFTSAALHYERFRPATLLEFVARPLDLLSTLSRQNTEGRAPDLRFAVLFVAFGGAAAMALSSRVGNANTDRRTIVTHDSRALIALATAFLVAWCLWLKSSGNSRYFIPMGCVAAALLAVALHYAYRRWKDATLVALTLIVIAQGVQIVIASDWERDGVEWKGPLLELEYPDRFRNEAELFLSTSFLSGSAFLSHWHPHSGMITISGFYAIGPDRPGFERAQALIARNAGHLRSLTLLPSGFDETAGLPGQPSELDIFFRRFGLAIDPSDCEFVKAKSNLVDAARVDDRQRWSVWVSCRLRPDAAEAERYAREVSEVDTIFDRVEAACPNLFHPLRPVTEQFPNWTRLYNMGSELQLWIADGRLLYRSPLLGGDPIDIGRAVDWARAPQPIDCSRKFAPAFGMGRR